MAAKPVFKLGDLAQIDRFGFPGMPIDTPVVIVEVKKAGKRESYQHRYRVMAESTREAWAYEEDLRLTRDAGDAGGFGVAPSDMTVRKGPDFSELGEWIVNYASQTFHIYYDRSIFPSWVLAFAPGQRSERHGDDVLSIGSKSEALAKLKAMIDADDPRLAKFRRK